MRLPKFRISLRLMMVFVALAALACGGWVLRQRSREYQKKAAMYALAENSAAQSRESWRNVRKLEAQFDELRKRQADFAATVARKYGISRSEKSRVEVVDSLRQFEEERIGRLRTYVESVAANADYYRQLKHKYENAARHPWLSVAPDPPPPDPAARAIYWLNRRKYELALADYKEDIRRFPEDSSSYNSRAWIWATCPDAKYRDGRRAIESATRAGELDGWENPASLDTLAAAYAEAGQFAAAVRWQKDALDRIPPNSPDLQGYKDRLTLYQQGKPYRDEPKAE